MKFFSITTGETDSYLINTSSLAVSRSITENCVSHIEERGKIAPPSAHRKWIECYFKLLLCVAKPYIGEVARRDGGVKSAISSSCLYQIFIPSFTLRVLSRYFLASLLPDKDGILGNEIFVCINPLALRALPLYSLQEHRGSARRARGLKRLYRGRNIKRQSSLIIYWAHIPLSRTRK